MWLLRPEMFMTLVMPSRDTTFTWSRNCEAMKSIELGGTVENPVTGIPKGHGYVALWKPAEMLP